MVLRFDRGAFLRALGLLSLVIGVNGCRGRSQLLIAVIPPTTAQEVWESAHFEAVRIANSWKWSTFWNGPSRSDDVLRQIQIMDKEVDRGVAGIILVPDHAVALISPVRAAVAKKIPVAILDNPLAASPKQDVVFILNDNAAMGHIAAERVSHYLKGRGNEVAVLGVHPSFLGTIVTANAMKEALQQYDPDIHVVEQRSTFGSPEASDTAEDLLKEHPGLRAIVTLNVSETRSVLSALSREKLVGKIALIGCEQDFDLIYHVRTGEMDSVIAKDTRTMVSDAMDWIHRRREGTATGETILVTPKLVTRQNVDSPDVQQILAVNGNVR